MPPRRALALLLTLSVPFAGPAIAFAQPANQSHQSPEPAPARLHRGIVVVAAKGASVDETWRLATRVYQDPAIRPRGLRDATARALAGELPTNQPSPRVLELYEIRSSLLPTGAATRRLLGSIGSQLGVSGVLLTYRAPDDSTRARLFVVKRGVFDPHVVRPERDDSGRISWEAAVTWLSSLTGKRKERGESTSGGNHVLASPWFWGALTAAAGVVLIGYAATRDDEPEAIHLQGRMGP